MAKIFLGAVLIICMVSSALQAYNVYYGNLHAHCSYSDGIGTPQEAFSYARDSANIHVQALTDHTHMLTTSEYSTLRTVASAYTAPGVFVAIAGQEHGSLSTTQTGAFGHMNFYEATSLIPQYENGGKDYRYNLSGTYSWLVSHTDGTYGKPLFGVFNHPYETGGCGVDAQFRDFAYSVTGDSAMALIEIRNGQRSDSYEAEYFEALAKGWHVGVMACQDNHDGMWGNQPNPNSGNDIYLTGILADTLTKEAILSALRDRRTFAVEVNPESDRMGIYFFCEGHWMGDIFESVEDTLDFDITIWGETNFISVELIRNGIQVAYASPNSNSFHWQPRHRPPLSESYYLVRAQQTDGDYLWSSPIWVMNLSGGWDAIASVKKVDQNGVPIRLYESVTIKGIVTAGTGTFSTVDNYLFVQDATGGVNVVKRNTQTPYLSVGDSLTVTGTVDQYAGQTRISSPTITIEATGLNTPEPRLVRTGEIADTVGEIFEGLLVKVSACSIVSGEWPQEGYDGSVVIDDGSGGCTLFIDKDTDLDGSPPSQPIFDVVGIVGQYDPNYPYWSGYRLMPRSTADITSLAGIADKASGDMIEVAGNPAIGRVKISFLGSFENAKKAVTFYTIEGREIARFSLPETRSWFEWPHQDDKVSSGIYIVVVESDGEKQSAKIVLVR
ncbi:MAG: hypothetical protein ACUVQ7_04890 [bacterium]